MKACFSQSTSISDVMTIKAGEKMLCRSVREGMTGMKEVGSREKVDPLSSIRFRTAMMASIKLSWKRSTMSATGIRANQLEGKVCTHRHSPSEIGFPSQTF